jgi:hypothetical protein
MAVQGSAAGKPPPRLLKDLGWSIKGPLLFFLLVLWSLLLCHLLHNPLTDSAVARHVPLAGSRGLTPGPQPAAAT